MTSRIETPDDLLAGLVALARRDARLAALVASVGEVPLRRDAPGFASLVSIIVSQQISRAAAGAILGRLSGLVRPLDAPGLLAAGEEAMREAGLSRPKQRTLFALADAVAGGLDLVGLGDLPAETAIRQLTAVHGVGDWTAEVYLLVCAGHADIFPAGDVALRTAVGDVLGIEPRPSARDLRPLAESWSPWRSVAARLFWAHYRTIRGREALAGG